MAAAVSMGAIVAYDVLSPVPYSVLPRVEYLHEHLFPVRKVIYGYFLGEEITLLGGGYNGSGGGPVVVRILRDFGIVGAVLYVIVFFGSLMRCVQLQFTEYSHVGLAGLSILIFQLKSGFYDAYLAVFLPLLGFYVGNIVVAYGGGNKRVIFSRSMPA